jgi:hypothetical protein
MWVQGRIRGDGAAGLACGAVAKLRQIRTIAARCVLWSLPIDDTPWFVSGGTARRRRPRDGHAIGGRLTVGDKYHNFVLASVAAVLDKKDC